jgi:hypothetical protein
VVGLRSGHLLFYDRDGSYQVGLLNDRGTYQRQSSGRGLPKAASVFAGGDGLVFRQKLVNRGTLGSIDASGTLHVRPSPVDQPTFNVAESPR